jgi:CheY-like chemotaxis protein
LSLEKLPEIEKERKNEILKGNEVILVVEDSQEVRSFTCETLQSLGYQVYEAPDGIEALEVINAIDQRIDLLISDVIMPRMSGKELASKVTEKLPDTKVLFTSGYSDSQIAHDGVLKSGLNFLQKPYSIKKLATKVRQVLEKKIN